MIARVASVNEVYYGSPLTAAVLTGDTTLTVEDVSDFDESGELLIGSEVVAYSAIDADINTITVAPLASGYSADEFVYVHPATVDRVAWLTTDTPDGDEGLLARVPHSLWDRLELGARDLDAAEGESVTVEFEGDELVIVDVLSRTPVVNASFIDTTTFTTTTFSDGAAPASSPTPTVVGGPSFLAARWTAVSNTDPVTYEVHVSASTGFTPSGSTLYAETSATSIIVKTLADGSAFAYGTTYYVRLIAKDADGSAAAGTQGSAAMVKTTTAQLETDNGTPNTPTAPTVVSGPGWIQAKWSAVTGTADPLVYKVYVRGGSAPTVDDDTYAVGTTTALSLVISKLADGSALASGTTYYVKVRAISSLSPNASAGSDSGTGSIGTVSMSSSGITTDGNAPTAASAPTVQGGIGYLAAFWDPVSNNDEVAYEVHLSASSGFTPGAGTLCFTTPGTSAVLRKLPDGSALAYSTTYYVKIIAKDADGSASASSQGSASLTQATGGSSGDIAATTVTAANIAANTITASQIAAGTITATEIAASTITGAKIAATTITSANIAANTITAGQIAAATITATEIAASTITGAKIAATTITASNIVAGTITATEIAASTITGAKIAASTITASNIAADTITASQIAADAITASELATDAVTAAKIQAGAITAAKLESSLVLSTKVVAGSAAGARVELGIGTDGTGLYSYNSAGTQTFSVDAGTGNVYASGRLDFGSASRLDSDIIELGELPSTGYQTPTLVQSASTLATSSSASTTKSVSWSNSTTAGNLVLLLVAVTRDDSAATAPTITTPSGWTLITSATRSGARLALYKIETSARRSGAQSVAYSLSGGVNNISQVRLQLYEYAGVGAQDVTATSSGSSTTASTGTTATTAQADELWFGALMDIEGWGFNTGTLTNSFSAVRYETTAAPVNPASNTPPFVLTASRVASATGTASTAVTAANSTPWVGLIVTFKSKTASVDAPAADKLRIYALDDGVQISGNDASMLVMQNEFGVEKSLEFPGLTKFHDTTAPSYAYVWSDFLDCAGANLGNATLTMGCILAYSGTGAGPSGINNGGSHPGVIRIDTGTTTSGYTSIRGANNNSYKLSAGRIRMGALVRVPTLSTGTETFYCFFGLKDATGGLAGVTTNSVGIRYSSAVNSGKWQAFCSNGASSNVGDTGVTVTANQWYWLEIDVSADGTAVQFFVNGSRTNSFTSAIQTALPATANVVHYPAEVQKSAGTTARSLDIDFYYAYAEHGTRASS